MFKINFACTDRPSSLQNTIYLDGLRSLLCAHSELINSEVMKFKNSYYGFLGGYKAATYTG
jgi:hypothetical protein